MKMIKMMKIMIMKKKNYKIELYKNYIIINFK